MTMETYERKFAATLDGLKEATEYLDEICMSPRIAVIFDEIASNIVRCSGASEFNVKVSKDEDWILEISDDGKQFDPTATKEPDITAGVEDRGVGGLGLFMVKKMSKSFTWQWDNGKNIVTVVVK